MAAATCLPRETLKQYLVGDVEESQTEAIESHLASCPECEQTVVELEANPDTLMVGIRALTEQHGQQSGSSAAKIGEEPSVVKLALAAVRQLPETSPKQPSEWPVGFAGGGQIGAYELLRPLGRGGMGMVLLARHRSLQKEVAIKLLSSLVGDKPELVTRFQREMRAAGRLQHPAIVNATDAGQERGTHYLVMEYVAGLDLSRIARLVGRLSIADACELMRQAALGLSHAHAEGIVHRDVKPSNLMLDATGHVKILDFGLAQINLWDEPVCELTTVGQLMGTIDYMAPEQAERIGAVDYRADLYALGATLFRLLAGRAPLAASPHMTLLEKVRMLGSQTSPLLSSVREDCPPELVQLVSQLLSRDPAARPASAAHVAQALEPFCSGSQLVELLATAQAAAVAEPVADAAVESAMQPSLQFAETVGSAKTPAKPPTSRWLWTAAAALPLMVFAGILITIETQKGQLVIQSDVADVQIKVARDGKVVDELTVHPGAQSTRLRADKYEILIDSPSDQVVVDKQQFSIKSGETVVATIKQVEQGKATLPLRDNELAPNSEELTYDGTSYLEWLRKLATDVSEEKQLESLKALNAIGERQQIKDARPVILQVLKDMSRRRVVSSKLFSTAFSVLSKTFENQGLCDQFLAIEVKNGHEEWQSFILDSHRRVFGPATPLVEIAKELVLQADAGRARTVAAAGDYLFSCTRTFAAAGNEASVTELLAALERSPGLTMSFWIKNLYAESDRVFNETIRGTLSRVAARALANKISAEDGVRALMLIDRYGDLSNLDWLEPFVSQLVDNPERVSRFYQINQDTLSRVFISKTSPNFVVDIRNGEAIDALRLAKQANLNSEQQAVIRRLLDVTMNAMPNAQEWVNQGADNQLIATNFNSYRVRSEDAWNRLTDTQRGLVVVATAASSLLPENDFKMEIDFPDSMQVGQRAKALINIRNNSTVSLTQLQLVITNDAGLKAVAVDSASKPYIRPEEGKLIWLSELKGSEVQKFAIEFEAVTAASKATIQMRASSGDKVLGETTSSTAIAASQKETVSDVDVPGRPNRSAAEQITFNQISYEQWLHILSTDLSDEKLGEAFKAIIAISAKRNIADARPVIVEVLKSLSKQSSTQPVAQIALQALYMSFDQDEAKYDAYLAQMLSTGSADEQRLILVNIAGKKVQRESMGEVIVQQAIRIATSPTNEQSLTEAAGDYLCYVWCNLAPRSSSLEGKDLDGVAQQICDTLLNCPQLNWKFWARWQSKTTSKMMWEEVRIQLAEFFVRAAERVVKDVGSTPEDCVAAVKVFSTYKNRMQDTDWIEPYIERVLADPKRQTAIYEAVLGDDKLSPSTSPLSQSAKMVSRRTSAMLRDSMRSQPSSFSDRENELLLILSAIRNQNLLVEKQLPIRRVYEAAQKNLPTFLVLIRGLYRGAPETYQPLTDGSWEKLDDRQRVFAFIAAYAMELLDSLEGGTESTSTKEPTKRQPTPEDLTAALRGNAPANFLGKDGVKDSPAEPFFDGRTLSQWFEILERDRDEKARATAMKAIDSLASKAESSKITERLIALARRAKVDEWSDYEAAVNLAKYGGVGQRATTLDSSLIYLLLNLNGEEWFKNFLVTDLLVGDDIWTARWLAALWTSQNALQKINGVATIFDHYKNKEAFDALGPNSARLVEAWLIQFLTTLETPLQPRLGKATAEKLFEAKASEIAKYVDSDKDVKSLREKIDLGESDMRAIEGKQQTGLLANRYRLLRKDLEVWKMELAKAEAKAQTKAELALIAEMDKRNEADMVEHAIKLIEQQPHLGKQVVLQIDAEIGTRFLGWNRNSSVSRQQLMVEEAIAKYAKAVLENDESNPEAVARAASRLASTTEIVDGWKPELLKAICKRFASLAADHTRLVTTLPIEGNVSRPTSQLFATINLPIPVTNRFVNIPVSQQLQNQRNALEQMAMQQMAMRQFRQSGLVPPYIESECMALIALMIRLNGASECEKELKSIAEKTQPDFDALMTQSGARELRAPALLWPYRISTAGEPWTKISADTWHGWAIHRTLFEFFAKERQKLPLLNVVLLRTGNRLSFTQSDQNSDGKLSSDELSQEELVEGDSNKDGSLDFEEYTALLTRIQDRIASENSKTIKPNWNTTEPTPELMEWAKRQVSKYDANGDDKLSAAERKHMVVDIVGADSNGDDEITVEEYAKFRKQQ